MIEEMAQRFTEIEEDLYMLLKCNNFGSYKDLLRITLERMNIKEINKAKPDWFGEVYCEGVPDYRTIYEIDDGYYQGTLLFVVPELDYQPCNYFTFKVEYGSCAWCDTLQGIQDCKDETEKAQDYKTLCMHMIQSCKIV
ncbi:MAG: hypothetical protein C0602_06000 [Denitrovibrio sp.]|nr:MAG: hypothetical protein C0602_06000 [Denitrovibrio sp.]